MDGIIRKHLPKKIVKPGLNYTLLDECDPPCLDANMQCHLYMASAVQWLSPFHRSQKFVEKGGEPDEELWVRSSCCWLVKYPKSTNDSRLSTPRLLNLLHYTLQLSNNIHGPTGLGVKNLPILSTDVGEGHCPQSVAVCIQEKKKKRKLTPV